MLQELSVKKWSVLEPKAPLQRCRSSGTLPGGLHHTSFGGTQLYGSGILNPKQNNTTKKGTWYEPTSTVEFSWGGLQDAFRRSGRWLACEVTIWRHGVAIIFCQKMTLHCHCPRSQQTERSQWRPSLHHRKNVTKRVQMSL